MFILALALQICSCQIEDHETQQVINELLRAQKEAISAHEIGSNLRIMAIGQKEYINVVVLWQDDTSLLVQAYDRYANIFTEEFSEEMIPIILKQVALLDAP